MKPFALLSLTVVLTANCSPKKSDHLKPLLLEQLHNTHTNQEWFVPTQKALAGLTAEQSNLKDSTENHSIGELTSHLIYWTEMNLRSFAGEDMTNFKANNDATFHAYTETEWAQMVIKLDSLQTQWEQQLERADAEKVVEWSTEIANMTAHNAYHTGQIIYIRKRNNWWK